MWGVFSAVLAGLLAGPFLRGVDPVRPNVVFILADDVGVRDLALYGSKFHRTPHIDALATRGLLFTQASSASPLCSPTRASIMTGLYPARVGITSANGHLPEVILRKALAARAAPGQKALPAVSVTRLDTTYYTLAEAFRDNGYVTAHFGKWHLGAPPYSPLEHGFGTDIPHTPAPSPLPKGFFFPFPVWKNHGKPGDHLEDLLCDEAVAFIAKQSKDRPFFLNYWSFEAHSPWQAKDSQIERYRAAADPHALQRNPVYAGMIETLDEVVGRLVAALDKAGLLENTLIVFTSDNGPYNLPNTEHMPEEFWKVPPTSALPLRGAKACVYEGGVRVPLVMVWPGHIKSGATSAALVQSTDFFPTLADLVGLKVPAGIHFDGVNQRAAIEGKGTPREEVFCHFPHGNAGHDYEGMVLPTASAPGSSLRVGDWKLVRLYCEDPGGRDHDELYNLANDPGETRDLSASEPARVRQLAARLDQILADTGAVLPKPNPDYRPGIRKGNRRAGESP